MPCRVSCSARARPELENSNCARSQSDWAACSQRWGACCSTGGRCSTCSASSATAGSATQGVSSGSEGSSASACDESGRRHHALGCRPAPAIAPCGSPSAYSAGIALRARTPARCGQPDVRPPPAPARRRAASRGRTPPPRPAPPARRWGCSAKVQGIRFVEQLVFQQAFEHGAQPRRSRRCALGQFDPVPGDHRGGHHGHHFGAGPRRRGQQRGLGAAVGLPRCCRRRSARTRTRSAALTGWVGRKTRRALMGWWIVGRSARRSSRCAARLGRGRGIDDPALAVQDVVTVPPGATRSITERSSTTSSDPA